MYVLIKRSCLTQEENLLGVLHPEYFFPNYCFSIPSALNTPVFKQSEITSCTIPRVSTFQQGSLMPVLIKGAFLKFCTSEFMGICESLNFHQEHHFLYIKKKKPSRT